MEIWKDIPGYEGRYQVSDLGRVRSLDRIITLAASSRRGACLVKIKGKVLRPYIAKRCGGYWAIVLYDEAKGTCHLVHALVMLAFTGPRPKGKETLHRDGDPTNARLSNLRYGTRKENVADARRHGTITRGERQGHAKLTREDILTIRGSADNQYQLAEAFGVAQSNISRIKNNKTWRHV